MDQKMSMQHPDYQCIYTDIISEKFPEKFSDPLIQKKLQSLFTTIDILQLDQLIFGDMEYTSELENQRLKSYDKNSVLKILEYQKKNKLTNAQTAAHFKMSRNTLAKWKSLFQV
ncbi:DNA-binding transcriptional regulator YiaG [Chryseobacterium sp. 2987]|uniref:helix-turn-helix domain-containing protein n=2 Tax=Chryseobacterium TaxID=59732 RepID=UPI001E59D867|nr:helix-turn-helix domain-containing protein [Chryseobacterium vaccae]MDR6922977.1 DNA-binding transcriptional regulator YiaG [Chryseobacterium sp. 2987]